MNILSHQPPVTWLKMGPCKWMLSETKCDKCAVNTDSVVPHHTPHHSPAEPKEISEALTGSITLHLKSACLSSVINSIISSLLCVRLWLDFSVPQRFYLVSLSSHECNTHLTLLHIYSWGYALKSFIKNKVQRPMADSYIILSYFLNRLQWQTITYLQQVLKCAINFLTKSIPLKPA